MGLLVGGGLLLLGIILIVGVFVLGSNRQEENSRQEEPDRHGHLSDILRHSPVELIPELEKSIREGDYQAVDLVIDGLDYYPAEKRDAVLRFLTESGAAEHYKTKLIDVDYRVRAAAAERLGKIGGPGAAELLFQAMADKNEEVRLAATAALQKQGDPSVSPRLVKALKEPNRWLPARIAEVLVSMGQPCVPALHDALHESDPVFRGYVIEILGEIGDKSTVGVLHGALRDSNSNIRLQSARALGKIASPESVPLLIDLAADPEVKVRVQAARSLGMTYGQAMRYVVLPQAIKIVVPPLTNELIAMIKDTSLVSVIAVPELLFRAKEKMGVISSPTPLTVAAIIYVVFTIPLIRLAARLEKKSGRQASKPAGM